VTSNRTAAACIALACALAAPGAAAAALDGAYSGKLYSVGDRGLDRPLKGTKVSFKVKNGKVRTFTASGGIKSCFNAYFNRIWTERLTFAVPSAAIKHNHFRKKYVVRKDGDELGTNTLEGKFSGKQASGTLEQAGGYCKGGYRWSVRHK